MAGLVIPDETCAATYRGLRSILEFTNRDGQWVPFNCGQAAACTLLAHHQKLTGAAQRMRAVESAHPPDNLGGWLGTSRRRVERICRAFGLDLDEIEGEEALRWHLGEGRPVIVMLGVAGPRLLNWRLPAGHWMVAFGYDDESIYLTNHGPMPWRQFRAGWH